jgi:cephalosporin hydroxylase
MDIVVPSWADDILPSTSGRWTLLVGDSREVEFATGVDLLVIDTVHRYDHLLAELQRHGDRVSKWIVIHDTETYGRRDEPGNGEARGPGLWPAIEEYCRTHPEWTVETHYPAQHGLTILSRRGAR